MSTADEYAMKIEEAIVYPNFNAKNIFHKNSP